MKRRYQMEKQRAVNEFRRFAADDNPTVQMPLPMKEVLGMMQSGVGNLLRQAGLELMKLVMDEEVRHLAGERYEQYDGRQAQRWGKEDGYCVIDGQKAWLRHFR